MSTELLTARTKNELDRRNVQPGTVLAGRYAIEIFLGEGASNWVFSAIDFVSQPPQRVAIKLLKNKVAEDHATDSSIWRELRILTKVHAATVIPSVVRPLLGAMLIHDEQAFYVMEIVNGPTLREELVRRGTMELKEALTITAKLAQGLSSIHKAGYVHRDLKPDNIRLRNGTDPVLLDLGNAVDVATTQHDRRFGVACGTPAYAAPEQLLTYGPIGASADIYSLGIILSELLYGYRPASTSRRKTDRLSRIAATSTIEKPIPPPLTALVQRCLERDPAKRPSAEQVEAEISAFLANGSIDWFFRRVKVRRALIPILGAFAVSIAGVTYALSGTSHIEQSASESACITSYNDARDLPRLAQVMDFERCRGCACCETGQFYALPQKEECVACAARESFSFFGISMDGVIPAKTILGYEGMADAPFGHHAIEVRDRRKSIKIHLRRPRTIFGVTLVWPPEKKPPLGATIVGFDNAGAIVATTQLHVPWWRGIDYHARFAAIATCGGTYMTEVEIRFDDQPALIDNIVLYPPPASENTPTETETETVVED